MQAGVRFSWRAFGVALAALVVAVALFVVASYRDSWGTAVQYSLGTLAVLAVVMIGYVVAEPWVLLLPWTVVAAWSVLGAIFQAASSSPEWAELFYGVTLLVIYALVVELPLAGGLGAAAIRDRRRWPRWHDRPNI